MFRTLHTAILLLVLGATLPAQDVSVFPSKPQPGYSAQCAVARVIDGDTIEVEVKHLIRVRLLNCWSPESRTTDPEEKVRGLAAKQHLIDLAKPGSEGTVFIPAGYDLSKTQTLNRLLGYVWIDGHEKSLNEIQVEAGYAKLVK